MIIFKHVKYKNLLSSGNDFTEIALNDKKTTLIVGRNGAGKSTFLDALSYCLYNKAFRNINKPQLMNSINNRGLLVEVEFSIGGREYLIRRGQKPNIFEIIQDGKLLNQVADNRDYQGMLENNILRMNHRSFRQIVVLGSANFVPFMQLPSHARREVIEDLLDIQVFSAMNSILKARVAKNKDDLVENQHQIDLVQTAIELQQKHAKELRQNNEHIIETKIQQINDFSAETEEYFQEFSRLEKEREDIEQKLSSKDWSAKLLEAKTIRSNIEKKIAGLQKRIEFYKHQEDCPTCKQSISPEFKMGQLQTNAEKLQKHETSLESLDDQISRIGLKLHEQNGNKENVKQINSQLSTINAKINSNNRFISGIQEEIESLRKKSEVWSNDIVQNSESEDRLKSHKTIRDKLLSERETLGVAASLLKDGGIKALIIKQYVPVMNKLINKYLQMMEFYVDFQLDETFKESILSRGRDDFSYDSFSQGEKMRIDLAILFTWRAIAKMRNSSSTNLLIFDEIFDSSLDGQGTDDFIKIIHSLTMDTNTFIISHKVDNISDKFENVIRFEKIKNFSRMIAA